MKTTIQRNIEIIENYIGKGNAATVSKYDSNANVTSKNIATLSVEINKFDNILLNRHLMYEKIKTLYNEDLSKEYIRQLELHEIYTHDETSLKPYCASVSMYPFLFEGLQSLGGDSKPPKNIDSFCGSFINLIFALASQFAGAIATVEFLMYFDYYARKEWGNDYYLEYDKVVALGKKPKTIEKKLDGYFQQVVYSINQPAAARGYQSVFWNITVFDKYYFQAIFSDFVFPDGSKPHWDSINRLQQKFLSWFNSEREKSLLTFPVVTMALLTKNNDVYDEEYKRITAKELSEGQSMFIYMSEKADSLASCCRLRSEFSDNTFSYSLGAGGVSTGSINVITMNLNRIVQKNIDIKEQVKKIHKYQYAYYSIIKDFLENDLLPAYNAGFISLEKQFLTIGVNGLVEAAEFLSIDINDNEEYKVFVNKILKPIYDENKLAKKKYGVMFNTEFVPAENLGVKNALWDTNDNLEVKRECYNSYFYIVEDERINPIDKFILHGEEYIKYLDGGSALHLNLEEHLDYEQYLKILKIAAINKTNYWTINVLNTICNSCGHIDKATHNKCPRCFSYDVDYATRVIGYLKRIKNFSKDRQKEAEKRYCADALS